MRALALLATVALAGCVGAEREALDAVVNEARSPEGFGFEGPEDDMPPLPPRPTPANRTLAFEALAPCTPHATPPEGVRAGEETHQVLFDPDSWPASWDTYCTEQAPAVDFTRENVIVATWGAKPAGHSVAIVNVTQRGSTFHALLERIAPAADCEGPPVYPVAMARTERVFEVDFEFLDIRRPC